MDEYEDADDLTEAEEALDYENVDDAELARADSGSWLRWLIWGGSALIVLAMVAVPALRLLDDYNRSRAEPNDTAQAARTSVALRFSSAMLDDRSARVAIAYAEPELRGAIEQLIGSLQERDARDLDGAQVALARVACVGETVRGSECFQSWLRQPGQPEVMRIRFTVAVIEGQARVVAVERVASVAGGAGRGTRA